MKDESAGKLSSIQRAILLEVTREMEQREEIMRLHNLVRTILNTAIHALSHGQAWATVDRIGVLVEGLQDIMKLCDEEITAHPSQSNEDQRGDEADLHNHQ